MDKHRECRSVWSAANPNANLALYYAEGGFQVLPCCPCRKVPIIKGGEAFKSASSDPAQIAEWWHRRPNAMPGLATSSFWVADVDVRPDGRGLAEVIGDLAPLLDQAGLEVATPSGGRHFYFARTPGVATPPRPRDIAPGIDTRGHGEDGEARSYIIAPGAIRADGRRYEIVRGAVDEIGTAPRKLLALAHFNKGERAAINADILLRSRLNEASPDCWRALYDERQAEKARATPRPVVTIDAGSNPAMWRQAEADLQERADRLARTSDGRKCELFRAAAAVAKYEIHGVLPSGRVEAELVAAWHASGAAKAHGPHYARRTIADAFRYAANDGLPLIARRFRDTEVRP